MAACRADCMAEARPLPSYCAVGMVTVYVALPIRTWIVLFVLEIVGMVWGILRSSIRAWCVPSRTSVEGSWIVKSDDVPEILSRLSTKICLIYSCKGFLYEDVHPEQC